MAEPGLDLPLSAALRAATLDLHQRLEALPLSLALAQGRVDLEAVAALLAGLRPAYAALEAAARRHVGDPLVGGARLPVLVRTPRLDADLAALAALGAAAPAPGPAARAYASRVAEAGTRPLGFLAHHWTRSLADLSGGQVVASALARTLGLDATRGASWLAVDAPPARLRAQYRAGLDALPLDAAQRRELVGEARCAHELNAALLEDMDGTVRDGASPR